MHVNIRMSVCCVFTRCTFIFEQTFAVLLNHPPPSPLPSPLPGSNVASNLLTRFPNVTRCTYLDALVVARNRIKEIPDDALSGLEHLRIL